METNDFKGMAVWEIIFYIFLILDISSISQLIWNAW
jgi:hypothetical protein